MDRGTSTQIIATYGRANRLRALKENLSEGMEISDEELVNAYNSSEDVKLVDATVHTSSCKVLIGKISDQKIDLNQEHKDFLRNCSNNNFFVMFPKQAKKLDSIVSKVKIKKTACSIGSSNLMDIKTFEDEFLPYIKKMQEEMEKIKDSIREEFDTTMEAFEKNTLEIVESKYPEKAEDVLRQLNFIRKRGKEGYLEKISIEVNTGFDMKACEDFDDDLKDFLLRCKKLSTEKKAEDIICSLLSELWKATLSYLINISLERYQATGSLENSKAIRNNLLESALETRRKVKPLTAIGGGADILSLTESLEKLSYNMNRYDAVDEGYVDMVEIYTVAREHYGYELNFHNSTTAKIPDWLKLEDIRNDAEEVIKEHLSNKTN